MSNLRLLDPMFSDNFESTLRRFFPPTMFEREQQAPQMRIDVSERDDAYVVKADVPGVRKEDISVRVDGNMVQIDAEVRQETEQKDEAGKVLRSERHYGAVSRAFSLGQDIDDTKVEAKYADGVLTLALPKKPTASAKKIAIQ